MLPRSEGNVFAAVPVAEFVYRARTPSSNLVAGGRPIASISSRLFLCPVPHGALELELVFTREAASGNSAPFLKTRARGLQMATVLATR